jgi:hypothetical protein
MILVLRTDLWGVPNLFRWSSAWITLPSSHELQLHSRVWPMMNNCIFSAASLHEVWFPFDVWSIRKPLVQSLPHSAMLRLQLFSSSWRFFSSLYRSTLFQIVTPLGFTPSEFCSSIEADVSFRYICPSWCCLREEPQKTVVYKFRSSCPNLDLHRPIVLRAFSTPVKEHRRFTRRPDIETWTASLESAEGPHTRVTACFQRHSYSP